MLKYTVATEECFAIDTNKCRVVFVNVVVASRTLRELGEVRYNQLNDSSIISWEFGLKTIPYSFDNAGVSLIVIRIKKLIKFHFVVNPLTPNVLT